MQKSLFGVPVVVPFLPGNKKSDLYKNVWDQVSRLVSPLPPSEAANHAQDWWEFLSKIAIVTCEYCRVNSGSWVGESAETTIYNNLERWLSTAGPQGLQPSYFSALRITENG